MLRAGFVVRVSIPRFITCLSGLEWVIVSAIIGLILAVWIPCSIEAKHRPVEEAAQYSAWCKLTGNERGLTQDEFKVLCEAGVLVLESGAL